jgi:hypothetical protein
VNINTIVMQYDGQITDRGVDTSERVRSTDVGRKLIRGFDLMLDELLPTLLHGVAKAEFSFLDDQTGLFAWQQPEPFSAMASFFIGGALKFTWFYLTGIEPESDLIVARATTEFIQVMAMMAGQKHELCLPPERPLALCVPWPPSPNEVQRRIVGNYAICLATAFFETTDAIHKAGEALFGQIPHQEFRWDTPPSTN